MSTTNQTTTIPNWMITYSGVSVEARLLAAIILMQKDSDLLPTLPELATVMRVDVRSIVRWLDEWRSINLLVTKREGRRLRYRFIMPKKEATHDRRINDRRINDRRINDRPINDRPINDPTIMSHAALGHQKGKSQIADSPVLSTAQDDGGDVDSSNKKTPSSTTRRKHREPLTTAHARHMLRCGIYAAPEFDDPALDSTTWIAAVERMRADGLKPEAITYRLRLDPPRADDSYWQPTPASAPLISYADDLDVSDEDASAQIDGQADAPTLHDIWSNALDLLRLQVEREAFNTYLRTADLRTVSDGVAVVSVINPTAKTQLENAYTTAIREVLSELLGASVGLRVVIGEKA